MRDIVADSTLGRPILFHVTKYRRSNTIRQLDVLPYCENLHEL